MSEDNSREIFRCFMCKRPVDGVPKYLRPSLLSMAQLSFKEMQARHPLCTRCYKTVEKLYDIVLKERAALSASSRSKTEDSIDKMVNSNPLTRVSHAQDNKKTNGTNPVSSHRPSSNNSWGGSHITTSTSNSSRQSTNNVNNSAPGGSGLQANTEGRNQRTVQMNRDVMDMYLDGINGG